MKNTPFGFVREWVKSLSWIVRKTPTKGMVTWLERDGIQSVRLLNYTVNIDQYRSAVQSTLRDCLAHIHSKVLFNISLPDFSLQLPDDQQDELTRGYGLFSLSLDSDNLGDSGAGAASSSLLRSLLELGTLCHLDETSQTISWDTVLLNQWLANVCMAWEYVYILMHLLALPARGAEEELWQHANGPESARHLFVSHALQTLVTKSNYNKTSSITGIYKTIIRVIPYQVAQAVTILLGSVRPIELVATLQFQCSSPSRAQEISDLYRTRLFTTMGQPWNSERMSLMLRSWFMKHLKVPFSMRLHRQFAKALQRKFLSYQSKDSDSLAEAANLAMGHTQHVAEFHYGKETQNMEVPLSLQQKFEVVGSDWIEWHGIPATRISAEKK